MRSNIQIEKFLTQIILKKYMSDDLLKPPVSVVRSEIFMNWRSSINTRPMKVVIDRYIEWLDVNRPLPSGNSWVDLFKSNTSEIRYFFEHKDSPRPFAGSETVALSSTEKSSELLHEQSAKLAAIAGRYQLIRPFVGNYEKVILEPLEITKPSDGLAEIRMFSHQQPDIDLMYKGVLHLSSLYAAAILLRTHESGTGHAIRNVSVFVDHKKIGGKYQARHCLSGIILRGTSARTSGVTRMIIGVPFIAFQVDPGVYSDSSVIFESDEPGTHRVWPDSRCLIGQATAATPLRFQILRHILDRAFGSDGPGSPQASVLRTLPPDMISEIITEACSRAKVSEWAELLRPN